MISKLTQKKQAPLTRYVILGGAGAMGRITVKDLLETSNSDDHIIIADYDLSKAQKLIAEFQDVRLSAIKVDVKNHEAAAKAIGSAFVLINCTQYQLNIDVMEIALKLKCHYIDLGGLFHVTRKQLEYHTRFAEIQKLALLGMGAAPGITNILSRHAADHLDTVEEIHTRVGSMDKTRYEPKPALSVSYSLQTILEEFSFEPAVFTKGKFTFVQPMSGDTVHRFPAPIGLRKPMYTIHSEVATLPLSFAKKGVKEVSFKIAFDPEFTDRVRFLRDLGLGSHENILVGSGASQVQVRPIDVINKIAMNQPAVKQVGKLVQYEVVRAVVKGKKKNQKWTYIVDCHTSGMPDWGIGLDIDTGSPPAIAAQMLKLGQIKDYGALAAENAIDPDLFFKHLKLRKMKITVMKKKGWTFKV